VWTFSTDLVGRRPWREDVPIGPLGEQIGSMTRRRLILRELAALRAKPHGKTGLYQTVLDAFRYMKNTYRPDMVDAVLLQTDGKNNDPEGPTLAQTLATLKKEYDPNRPVQVVMIGFGKGVDPYALGQIAKVTHGSVYIVNTPGDIGRILREATARRICFPKC
jgi:Mg-chelatase subunit ChlD